MSRIDIWSDEFREAVERAFDDCAPDPADALLPGYEAPGFNCVIEHIVEELGIDPDEAEELLEEYLDIEENVRPLEPDYESRERQTTLTRFGG